MSPLLSKMLTFLKQSVFSLDLKTIKWINLIYYSKSTKIQTVQIKSSDYNVSQEVINSLISQKITWNKKVK